MLSFIHFSSAATAVSPYSLPTLSRDPAYHMLYKNLHFNMSMTKVAIAKANSWLCMPQLCRGPFSMRNVKVPYYSKFITDRIFQLYTARDFTYFQFLLHQILLSPVQINFNGLLKHIPYLKQNQNQMQSLFEFTQY